MADQGLSQTQAGVLLTEPVRLKQEIYQGDTQFCPLLFKIWVDTMSWILRTIHGCRLTKLSNMNISHGRFFDDLKLFSSSERQHWIKLALTNQMMEDMGLKPAARKTKTILMARRKRVEKDLGLQLSDDVMFGDQGDKLY